MNEPAGRFGSFTPARVLRIERDTAEIRIDVFMDRIRKALGDVPIDSGVSTDAYQPDRIMARITEIAKDAGVTDAEQAHAAEETLSEQENPA